MIQAGFPKHDWITRLAGEERTRDAAIARAMTAAERDAAMTTTHGPRLAQALATMVVSDVARFCQEFPDDPVRHLTVDVKADDGFEVRRNRYPTVTLSVHPRWAAGVVDCRYQFKPDAQMPVREDRFALGLAPLVEDDACFKHLGSGDIFADVSTLSEYLLTPVVTGKPRVG